MRAGRLRLLVTALVGVVAAAVALVVGTVALRTGRAEQALLAENDAQWMVTDALAQFYDTGEPADADDVWVVFLDEEVPEPLGEVSVEAPVVTVAQQAVDGGGEAVVEFESEGEPWLAYGRALGDDQAAVSVVWLGDAHAEVDALQERLLLLGAALTLAAVAVAFGAATVWVRPLRAASDQQREFIADAAHELRTPLSVIQASASHALSRERSDDEYRRSLAEIRDASERAGESVGELLELARLDAGGAQPRRAPLRLDLLLEEVASAVRVDGCEVQATPGDPIVVDADYTLLRQVVDNFARNAAVRSTHVDLAARVDGRWAVVEVTDDGPGFDPALLPYVFERFRRGDRRGTAGLGMAISKSILVAHGGSCEAENRPEGGAVVRLRLRVASSR